MDFLRVHGEADIAGFPAGLWGIKEPGSHWEGEERQSGQSPRQWGDDSTDCGVMDVVLNSPGSTLDLILLPGMHNPP